MRLVIDTRAAVVAGLLLSASLGCATATEGAKADPAAVSAAGAAAAAPAAGATAAAAAPAAAGAAAFAALVPAAAAVAASAAGCFELSKICVTYCI